MLRKVLSGLTAAGLMATAVADDDPFVWLEEVEGEKALEWVEDRNQESLGVLEKLPTFQAMLDRHLAIYNSDERIAYPSIRGEHLYNFWRDAEHERGIWRRTSLEQYRQSDTEWHTVLDVDALAEAEDENWVYKGNSCLYPDYQRCMISLSRGGADATVEREFNAETGEFVENGFQLTEAKSSVDWVDEDQLIISTDFGDGSMTDSGYPRIVKIWQRGTPLSDAKTLFEGETSDVGTWGYVINTPEGNYTVVHRSVTFYTSRRYLLRDGKLVELQIPDDADFNGLFKNQALVSLKNDWSVGGRTYPQGALISIGLDDLLQGSRDFSIVETPTATRTIASVGGTRNQLLLSILDNIRSELWRYRFVDGAWQKEKVDAPGFGTVNLGSQSETDDSFFFNYEGFLNPDSLYYVSDNQRSEKLKSLPEFFDASPYIVSQHAALSKDGTRVPYFMVARKDLLLDGTNPTLIYGYGGFEISLRPSYSATVGSSWLNHGGVYVVANIRGGGEFGPRWHHAALKENRQRAYDDFIAVAEDLINHKVTSPDHLGARGGSNGGLLMGAMATQRPDLFNAIVCQVPLLDMQRFNKLLAGASWMAEYGNPDIPEEWAYIKEYSPYHNLDALRDYPKVFFTTSTRDDRVHPGHARKMVAKMLQMEKPVYYYENTEGGHAGASNNRQAAYVNALIYSYLLDQLQSG